MPIVINEAESVSICELKQFASCGHSVVRSPHVGNVYPLNMLALQCGIRLNLYDRNYGRKDTNYHPHTVIIGGKQYQVADPDCLTCLAQVQSAPPSPADQYFQVGDTLVDVHTQSLQAASKKQEFDGRIEVFSEYISARQKLVRKILRPAFQAKPKLWYRYVYEDQAVGPSGSFERRDPPQSWQSLCRQGILSVTSDSHGWLIPLEVVILLDAIIEGLEHESFRVFHLSGPDMIDYIDDKETVVSRLYDSVREQTSVSLPAYLRFDIVPFANMSALVGLKEEKSSLQQVIALAELINAKERQSAETARDMPGDAVDDHLIPDFRREISPLRDEIREAISACNHLNPDIGQGEFISQYDLLSGRSLWFPERITHWSMKKAGHVAGVIAANEPE